MGLFSRMAPTDAGAVTAGELHDALMVKDVSRELEFRLQAFQGHLIGEEAGTTEVGRRKERREKEEKGFILFPLVLLWYRFYCLLIQ